MSFTPVAQFVREDGLHLLRLGLLDERVVDDDLFLPGQTCEIGIRVRGALRAVDDLQLCQREFEALGQRFHFLFQLAWLQWSEFVEERDDEDGVDCDCAELDDEREGPEVEEELVAGLLDDLEEGCAERDAEGEAECLPFEYVGDEEADCLLVEAVFLLQDEVVVVAEWYAQKRLHDRVGEGKDQ